MIDIPYDLREKHSAIAREMWETKVDPYADRFINRFLRRVKIDENGCWLCGYSLTSTGYTRIWIPERFVPVHRWTYILFKGVIPDGLDLDHLCRVKICVNPNHLEAVTHRENILRGIGASAMNAKKTHCIRGHPFNEKNTYMGSKGNRKCRICDRELHNQRYHASKGRK